MIKLDNSILIYISFLFITLIILIIVLSFFMKKANIKKIQVGKNGLDLELDDNEKKKKLSNKKENISSSELNSYLHLFDKYENFAQKTVNAINSTNSVIEQNFSSVFVILENMLKEIKAYTTINKMLLEFFNNIKNNFIREISYTLFQSFKNEIYKIIFDAIDKYISIQNSYEEKINTNNIYYMVEKQYEIYSKQMFLIFDFYKSEEYYEKLKNVFKEFLIKIKDILHNIENQIQEHKSEINKYKEELKFMFNKVVDELTKQSLEIIKNYIEEYIKYCEESLKD